MKNADPGYEPVGAFHDWCWYRIDAYKVARGDGPLGVPVRELIERQKQARLAA